MATQMRKPCRRCGEPKPVGRGIVYCHPCLEITRRECRVRDNSRSRKKPCQRCGGEKDEEVKRGRYCSRCKPYVHMVIGELERRRSQERLRQKQAEQPAKAPRILEDGRVLCARCDQYLRAAEFKRSKRTGRAIGYCKTCQSDYIYEHRLEAEYGITIGDYLGLLEIQGGICAICLRTPRKRRLAVDHNHKTAEVRGLLCRDCNQNLLGKAGDDVALLQRAIDYLTNPPARRIGGVGQ